MKKNIITLFIITMVYAANFLWAGTTGKIIGRVIDATNGNPLPGANISLEGNQQGAATDEDGFYLILNIRPGTYTVVAQMLGYREVIVSNVKVNLDLTTRLDYKLQPEALDLGEQITVTAERPLIRADVTSKLAVVDGEDITTMPVKNFGEVVASQAGITTDANGNFHFRGGRTNEVAYFIDGQPVENPIDKSFGGLIDNYAIQELQVMSGTFNAEYGSAMSGIVNIVTNEGGNKIRTKIEYTSSMLNQSPYRKANALAQDANPIYDKQNNLRLTYKESDGLEIVDPFLPFEGTFTGYLGGPIPGKIGNYFFSGEYKNENSWLPQGYNFTRSGFGKLTFPIGVNKFILSAQYSDINSQPYSHRYKYLPESRGQWEIGNRRYSLQYNHVFSERSYIILSASYLNNKSLFKVGDLHYSDYIFPESDENLEFVINGNNKSYSDFKSSTFNLKGDWLFQWGSHNEFKSGFELNQYKLDVFGYTNEGNNADEFFLNQYKKEPVTASLYVQDKIEYLFFIINLGLRGDYVDVKAEAYQDIENPLNGLEETESEFKLSPRLGLAYPISENTVFHFSYGHFFQFPNFQQIYSNLQFLNVEQLSKAKFALVANPKVKSQKTIAYEFGVSQKIGNNYALTMAAYSRDITDLLGTIYVETLYRYAIFTNNDFARIQGVDISLEKRMSNYWAAKLDYTYSVARGNEATPTEEAYNIFSGRPRSGKEFYLDFDRTHDIALNLSLRLPNKFGPALGGINPFQRLNLYVLTQFSSGLPYTPISDDRSKLFEKNSARMPWTNTVDVRLEKFFAASGFTFSVFLEVTNLFDRLNPLVVQPRTGKVWDDGKSHLFGTGEDSMHNPSDVGPPRIVKMGVSLAL